MAIYSNGWGWFNNDDVVEMYEIHISIGCGHIPDVDFAPMNNKEDAIKILQDFVDRGISNRSVYRFMTNQWRKEPVLYARPTEAPMGCLTGGVVMPPKV